MHTVSVTCLREPSSGKTWEFEQGRVLTVGRNEGNDWVFPDRSISRQHAVLDWPEGAARATVRDLGSANGTEVDGHRIPPHEPVALTHRCSVRFGELEFEVLLLTKRSEEPARRATVSGRFVRLVSNGRKALSGVVRGWDDLQDFLLKLESIAATGTLTVRLPHREVQLGLLRGRLLAQGAGADPVPEVLRAWTEVATCRFESAPQVEVEATRSEGELVAPSALFDAAFSRTRLLTRPEREVGDETDVGAVE